MAKSIDIQIDENGEDVAKDGDFLIEDTTQQNQQLLIICEKAENKMEPDSGVGIGNWVLAETDGEDLKKEIQSELEADGLVIDRLIVDGDKITTAGKYGS
jgi:transcription elongation GreA/GreB family factor